jgi:hypothetical protein
MIHGIIKPYLSIDFLEKTVHYRSWRRHCTNVQKDKSIGRYLVATKTKVIICNALDPPMICQCCDYAGNWDQEFIIMLHLAHDANSMGLKMQTKFVLRSKETEFIHYPHHYEMQLQYMSFGIIT